MFYKYRDIYTIDGVVTTLGVRWWQSFGELLPGFYYSRTRLWW